MGTPLSPLTSVILGLLCAFYAFLVETQSQDVPSSPLFTSPPPPPPPPPSLAQPPPPPLPSPFPSSPPPPSPSSQSLPPPSRSKGSPPPRLRRQRKKRKQPPPPPPPPLPARHRMNTGKKVGLLFVGIVAILQIGVVGFLVFKRKQLLKIKDRYENFPA